MANFWTSMLKWLGFSPAIVNAAQQHSGASGFATEDDGAVACATETLDHQDECEPETDQEEPDNMGEAWWVCEGEGLIEEPRLTLPEGAADNEVVKELQKVLESPDIDLPHLPQTPQQVLTMLRQTNINYPQIAKVIAQDQTLSAAVLRRANSAALAALQQITNLETALSRLGMRDIKGLMLTESLKSVTIRKTTDGRSPAEIILKRSLATAVIMERLSQLYNLDPDGSYLAGLLHDIGEIAVLKVVHDVQAQEQLEVSPELEAFLRQEYHQQLGGALAEIWHLPESISPMIAHHHGAIDHDDPQLVAKALLQISDMMACMMAIGDHVEYDIFNTPAARAIEFGTKQAHIDALIGLPSKIAGEQVLLL